MYTETEETPEVTETPEVRTSPTGIQQTGKKLGNWRYQRTVCFS